MEKAEDKPFLVFTVKDDQGAVVNRLTAPAKKGFQRVSWNLKNASGSTIGLKDSSKISNSSGYPVTPGTYSVTLSSVMGKEILPLDKEQSFDVRLIYRSTLQGASHHEFQQFGKEYESLQRELGAVSSLLGQSLKKSEGHETGVL